MLVSNSKAEEKTVTLPEHTVSQSKVKREQALHETTSVSMSGNEASWPSWPALNQGLASRTVGCCMMLGHIGACTALPHDTHTQL